MAPARKKPKSGVLQIHNERTTSKLNPKPKSKTQKKTAQRKKHRQAAPLTPSEKVRKILEYVKADSEDNLALFRASAKTNSLVGQCASLNTPSYSWATARAEHKAREQRLSSAHPFTPRTYYNPDRKATRVWVPKYPNESPYVSMKTAIPDGKHSRTREDIVRLVQDQETATLKVFESVTCMQARDKKQQMFQHMVLALRLEGVELFEWVIGCRGWETDVFFQGEESWKKGWGI